MKDTKGNVINLGDRVKAFNICLGCYMPGAVGEIIFVDYQDNTIEIQFDEGVYAEPGNWWAKPNDVEKEK